MTLPDHDLLDPANLDLDQSPAPAEPRTPGQDRRLGIGIVVTMFASLIALNFVYPGVLTAALLLFAILIPMVLFHEWGHYWTAKRYGVAAKEFFVGFGPRIWSFKRGETEFGIKAFFPAGGYVKIVGMSQYEDVDPRFEGRTFRDAKPWQRAVVLVAGSTTHFITGIVLLFALLVLVGTPETSMTLAQVGEGTPAEAAGLEAGDTLVAINGVELGNWDDAIDSLQSRPGETITITYERDGVEHTTDATLQSVEQDGRTIGKVGVAPGDVYVKVPPLEAVPESFALFGDLVTRFFGSLADTFSASNMSCLFDQMAGGTCETINRFSSPVGIASIARDSFAAGLFTFVSLVIGINVIVGITNLLPLLPLDGGHLAVLGVEQAVSKIRRRPFEIDQRHLIPVTVAVLALLAMIFMSALYLDLADPITIPR